MNRLGTFTTQVVTPPAVEPVTAQDAQEHLGVTDNVNLLESIIYAVRQQLEAYTGRAFVTQKLRTIFNRFPHSEIWHPELLRVPMAPLQSVESVKYWDLVDVERTFDPSNYTVVTYSEPGVIQLRNGRVWPSNARFRNAGMIEYTAGYGGPEAVPEAIRRAILMEVAVLFERRNPAVQSEKIDNASVSYNAGGPQNMSGSSLSPMTEELLHPFRIIYLS